MIILYNNVARFCFGDRYSTCWNIDTGSGTMGFNTWFFSYFFFFFFNYYFFFLGIILLQQQTILLEDMRYIVFYFK